jgi:hypothetical protein
VAILIKMLVQDMNSDPSLWDQAAATFPNFLENASEIRPTPHSLTSYGRERISLLPEAFSGDCAICKDSLETCAALLPCGHCFHSPCLEGWFLTHSTCPLCRLNIDYY